MAAKRSSNARSGRASANRSTRSKTKGATVLESLDRLEKELPSHLQQLMRQVRRGWRDMEKQLEKARADGERRWSSLETQVRRDAARLLRKLEKAVEPPKTRKRAPRKKSASRSSASSRTASAARAAASSAPSRRPEPERREAVPSPDPDRPIV